MSTIYYWDPSGQRRRGTYDLDNDMCCCSGGPEQNICLPDDRGARGYGYNHGGASYRALVDAIEAKEGADAIRAARR